MKETEDNGKSDIRFSASIRIPEGAEVVDFGMVYTLANNILKQGETSGTSMDAYDVEKLVTTGIIGDFGVNEFGVQAAVLSYKQTVDAGKKFRFSTYEEGVGATGSSVNDTEQLETADYVTFNLVIANVKSAHYSRFYAARSYCVYKYLGETFTIYDAVSADGSAVCSARSILYVAQMIYADDNADAATKQYVYG